MNFEYIPKNYAKSTVIDGKKNFNSSKRVCRVKKKYAEISEKFVEIFE